MTKNDGNYSECNHVEVSSALGIIITRTACQSRDERDLVQCPPEDNSKLHLLHEVDREKFPTQVHRWECRLHAVSNALNSRAAELYLSTSYPLSGISESA